MERILCAAIWYKELPLVKELNTTLMRPKNIERGLVFCGHRHPHCMYTMIAVTGLRSVTNGPNSVGDYQQGFLTSANRFVDRKEAAEIALACGQVTELHYGDQLYSEDLY